MNSKKEKQHQGSGHWMQERVTSALLVPLSLWLIYSITTATGFTHVDVMLWLVDPVNAILLLATLVITFHHAVLGLQVVIDDYIASPILNRVVSELVKGVFVLMTFACIVAIFRIAF